MLQGCQDPEVHHIHQRQSLPSVRIYQKHAMYAYSTREGGTVTKYDTYGLFVHYKITKTVNGLKIPQETKTWNNGRTVWLEKYISNKNT